MDVCSHFKLGYDRFSSYLTQVVRRISFNHLEISASLWDVLSLLWVLCLVPFGVFGPTS